MADLLLLKRVVGVSTEPNNSVRSCQNQIASLAAWVCVMYSASIVDNVTNSCFFEDQEMAPPSIIKTYPEIARLCS